MGERSSKRANGEEKSLQEETLNDKGTGIKHKKIDKKEQEG